MRKLDFKLVVGLVLISVIATSAIWYVWAATPTATFWISPGTYPGAPSYTIWMEGGNHFAKNQYGELSSGNNATTVLRACMTSGASLLLKEGIYIVTYLTLQTDMTLKGEGVDLVTIKQDDGINGDVIGGNGKSHIVISDLTIDGNKANNPTGDNGISLSSCSDVLIHHVVTKNNILKGIALSGCYDVTIRDSETFDNESDGYVIASQAGDGLNSYDVTIDNCHIHHNEAYGIGVISPTIGDKHPYDIFLTNNYIHHLIVSTNLDGINLKGADRVTITGNHIIFCDYGILGGQSADFPLTNILISGNTISHIVQYGIHVNYANNTIITSNRMFNATRAIYILAKCNFTTIVGNDVRFNTNFQGAIYNLGNHSIIKDNQGYMTEAFGTVEAHNGDAILFADSTGLRFQVTPYAVLVTVNENDARYIAQAYSIGGSQFILYLYDETGGALETVDKTISWVAYSVG